jgi:hypothetical protein
VKNLLKLVVVLCSVPFSASGESRADVHSWPVVREEAGVVTIETPAEADFTRHIVGRDGRLLYDLRCRSGDLDDVGGFNYSGLIQCRLSVAHATSGPQTLLFENAHATSDWEGRGRFLLSDILGSCGKYPDYGSTRSYRVRGMRLVLSVRDLRLQKLPQGEVGASSYVLAYDLKSDPAAKSVWTEKPSIHEPAWFSGSDDHCLQEANVP